MTTAPARPGTSTTTTAPQATRCGPTELQAALGQGQGAAGNIYIPLVLTNHSETTCSMTGYPGVSILDASGRQIGDPATRTPASATPVVVLRPGQRASALLHTINHVDPVPCSAKGSQIRVYPPDERDPITFPAAFQACGGFDVSPVVAGVPG